MPKIPFPRGGFPFGDSWTSVSYDGGNARMMDFDLLRHLMKTKLTVTAVVLGLALVGASAHGAEEATTQPSASAAPTTQGSAEASAPAVSPEARQVLDQVSAAYQKLQTLGLSGTIDAAFDVGGKKNSHHAAFSSTYKAPNQFRHEIKDDVLVGSTGEKVYAYQPVMKQYLQADAPRQHVASEELPPFVPGLLAQQNPSLLLALTKDPASELVQGAISVQKGKDQVLDGQTYTALEIETPVAREQVLVDPKTNLLKQVQMDLKKMLEQKGAPEVKQALLTFTYGTSEPGAAVKEGQFAWTPPADAKDASQQGGESDAAAMALVGKAAPDFTLTDLTGAPVKLSSQKGSVVILDFWATWCGPCVASLPHLNQVYEDLKGKGLKVFAVNVQEEKEKVQGFVTAHKLGMPILLDSQGSVGQLYQVEGIPQTVIIGKDGKVAKVLIGFGPGSEKTLRQAVETTMGQK
jgi:peroxiredoxin/outer membrane lipoprotein-sorting protein